MTTTLLLKVIHKYWHIAHVSANNKWVLHTILNTLNMYLQYKVKTGKGGFVQ